MPFYWAQSRRLSYIPPPNSLLDVDNTLDNQDESVTDSSIDYMDTNDRISEPSSEITKPNDSQKLLTSVLDISPFPSLIEPVKSPLFQGSTIRTNIQVTIL